MTRRRVTPGRPHFPILRTVVALGLALLLSLPALSPAAADPGPAAPAPQATDTPKATTTPKATSSEEADEDDEDDDEATASPGPSPSPSRTPRPDPEGDRWIQLAVVGGGSLLGAVTLFMVIGGLIRVVNRRRTRR